MKNLIFIIPAIFICINLNAQDILYLKSGVDVQVKVYEVGKKEIKYKKFNNLDGPVYSLVIKNIDRIKYQNGEEENFSQIKNNKNFEILPNAMSLKVSCSEFTQISSNRFTCLVLRMARVMSGIPMNYRKFFCFNLWLPIRAGIIQIVFILSNFNLPYIQFYQ